MNGADTMTDTRVVARATIRNRRGLHARAAAKFVKLAGAFDAKITVRSNGTEVPGSSIMGLMMLAAATGEWRRIRSANARAAGNSSSCGTTWLTRPNSSALSGGKLSPVSSSSSARLRPASRGRRPFRVRK